MLRHRVGVTTVEGPDPKELGTLTKWLARDASLSNSAGFCTTVPVWLQMPSWQRGGAPPCCSAWTPSGFWRGASAGSCTRRTPWSFLNRALLQTNQKNIFTKGALSFGSKSTVAWYHMIDFHSEFSVKWKNFWNFFFTKRIYLHLTLLFSLYPAYLSCLCPWDRRKMVTSRDCSKRFLDIFMGQTDISYRYFICANSDCIKLYFILSERFQKYMLFYVLFTTGLTHNKNRG